MKIRIIKILPLAMVLAALLPARALAQGTDNDVETDFRGRLSASIDKKLSKGLHLGFDGEVRFTDDFSEVGRFQVGTGLSYKLLPGLKIGAGYILIGNRNSSGTYKARHRAYFDLTESIGSGNWRFSFRERLQYTKRSDVNKYQTNPNALALKTRFKVQYKGFKTVTPYAYAELRIDLNDPACKASWDGTQYTAYEFKGYSDTYLDRVRGALGAEWKLSKKHSLDFTLMLDYNYSKNVDTNKGGTKLKSLTYDRTFAPTIAVGYKFAF